MILEARSQRTDVNVVADGVIVPLRVGAQQELMVTDSHPRYYDAVRRGNVYFAANTAGGALSLNSTTATGLIVFNPANSGKNLIVIELCVALATAPSGAATLVLTGGVQVTVPTGVTAITSGVNGVLPARVGVAGSTSVAFAYSAATIANTVIQRWVGGGPVATSSITPPFIKDQIDGALVLTPGSLLSLQCLTTAITVGASISWEEVPI
jgi:hypothetical protein